MAASARASLEAVLDRLWAAGVTVLTPEDCPALAAVEAATAEAHQITMGINAWEWRWPLGSFVARDASVLSPSALERHARSSAMAQAEYATLLARREAARAAHCALAGCSNQCHRTGGGVVGLETRQPDLSLCPAPCWGLSAVSLPVLDEWSKPDGRCPTIRSSPLEHQQDIRREQDEMDAALHDVRVAAGEGDDRDAERHD
jgi:hypothetical protein